MTEQTQEELYDRGQAHNSPSYAPAPMILDHGQGVYLYDRDGREYLDFVAGIAVNALGYNHPRLVQAIRDQAPRLMHVSNMFYTAEQVRLMEHLTDRSVADRVFLCNSGAEANEAAMKLARRYQREIAGEDRFEIITMLKSFHGRTMGAISATGQPKYHKGFEPMLPGFHYAEFNNLEDVASKIGDETAAIMVEPIQGEGGVRPADREFLEGLRALCDEHGLLLIFDEVQTGVGRTGHLFAYQGYGVEPDIFTLAKSLGGGFPVGAMLAPEAIFAGWTRGSHASTFGGNPLASAAALAVLETIEEDGLLEQVLRVGDYLGAKLEGFVEAYPGLALDARGRGLMRGLELGESAGAVKQACLDRGLLVNTAGGTTLRMVPPLIVEEAEVDLAAAIIDQALAQVAGAQAA